MENVPRETLLENPSIEGFSGIKKLELKDYFLTGEKFELYEDSKTKVLYTLPQPIQNLGKYYESKNYISHTDGNKSLFEKMYQFVKTIALKNKLEQAEKDATELATLKQAHEKLQKEKLSLDDELKQHKSIDEKLAEIETKTQEIEAREKKVVIDELKYQLAAEKEKTQFIRDIGMGLVRNVEYRKNVFDSEHSNPGGYQDTNGNWIYPSPSNVVKNYSETKEAK